MALIPPSQRDVVPPLPDFGGTLIQGTGDAFAGAAATQEEQSAYGRAGLAVPELAPAPIAGMTIATQGITIPGLTGAGGLISSILGALGIGGGAAAALGTVGGLAAGAYGVYEALGGGEGAGLFGLDILGGNGGNVATGNWIEGIPLSGPGLAEPPAAWIEKEWTTVQGGTKCQFYLVRMPTGPRKVAMYNFKTGRWKAWTLRKPNTAVIGKKLPSHKMIVRLRRNLGKHSADARTILKITSPTSLAQSRRRGRR